MFSPAVIAKAKRLVADRRVTRTVFGSYRVDGDTGSYLVTTDGKKLGFCTCPATVRGCAHLAAVLLVIRDGVPVPVDEPVVGDPFDGVTDEVSA